MPFPFCSWLLTDQMLPNRHASYSVNLYNSTSSLLANGTGINLFIDDIFSPILKCWIVFRSAGLEQSGQLYIVSVSQWEVLAPTVIILWLSISVRLFLLEFLTCDWSDKSRVDNIPDIAPFTCRLCCDDLLYNTSAMHMATNTKMYPLKAFITMNCV
jgi:hypothetical protein